MRRLDVLVLGLNYAPEPTGIAPYTTGLARMLADAGHRVHVVAGYPHYPQWRLANGWSGIRRTEDDGGVRVTRVRHPIPRRPNGPGRIVMELVFAVAALAARRRRPDVVITVSPALLSVVAGLRWRWLQGHKRTAVGVVVQDLYGLAVSETGSLGGRLGGLVSRLETALLSRTDGVVAVHELFRAGLAASVAPSKVRIIRNWTHVAPATGDAAALRAEMGWPADHVVALHAGNMGAKQGLENVVEAAAMAEAAQAPITFVLLGDGNQRARLEALGFGLERLRFVDPLPDGRFETALAAADVLVLNELPSVVGMCVPSKLTSYFAAGRPIVAATQEASPAAHEVRAAEAGVVVEPGEPALLLEAALTLGREVGGENGARGRAYAASACAVETAEQAYLDWVADLAGRPRAVRPPGDGPRSGLRGLRGRRARRGAAA